MLSDSVKNCSEETQIGAFWTIPIWAAQATWEVAAWLSTERPRTLSFTACSKPRCCYSQKKLLSKKTPLCKAIINPAERAPLPWCVGRGWILNGISRLLWFAAFWKVWGLNPIFCVCVFRCVFFSVRDFCFPLIFSLLCPFWGFGWWWEGRI